MFNLHLTYKWLRWTRSTEPPPPLPKGVERFFVPTPSGDLELLYAAPSGGGPEDKPTAAAAAPFYFVHGGMGSAWVWLEYMQYLSSRGVPCYAVSLRGHGESWHPGYLRMVYGTTRGALAEDLVAGVRWVQQREGGAQVVLVGHSSGGGLSQAVLSEGRVRVKGLALLGAIPGFGSMSVYMNWWRQDPLFTIRLLLHGWHPNSPLSHPALTKAIFFSDEAPDSYVVKFQQRTSAYESFLWSLSMMRPFVDTASLLKQIAGWGSSNGSQRILVMGGGGERLMTVPIMRRLAETYRSGVGRLAEEKKLDGGPGPVEPLAGEGGADDAGQGVRFCVVPGAGHHLQNDVQWEVGAKKLLEFYQQL